MTLLSRLGARMVALATVVTLCLATLPAHAGPAEEKKAQSLYDEGTAAYRAGDFERAVKAFEAASRLSADPVYLYNLGQALRRTGRARDALNAYQRYLQAAPEAPNKAAVQKMIAELRGQLEPERPPVEPPVAPPVTPPITAPPAKVDSPGRPFGFWLGLGIAIGGVGLAGAGVGLGASAKSTADELSNARPGTVTWTKALADKQSAGETQAKTGYALMAIGAVGAGLGIGLMIWNRKPKTGGGEKAMIVPTANGVMAHLRF